MLSFRLNNFFQDNFIKPFSNFLLASLLTLTVSAGPVSEHGLLRVDGAKIVGADGRPASFAGNSFFWSQWQGRFYNAGTVNWLRQDWQAGIVRAALGIEGGGYHTNPGAELAKITTVVDAAVAADLYVIVDWHDHQAHLHTEQAVTFFSEIARRYGTKPNLIYEIFNEPKKGLTWADDVKPYAEKVVAAIRAIDPDNLIVVGTPNWSQDVDVAAGDRISAENVAYALHFYAGTHKQRLRDKALKAMHQGLALFVTEWGTCNSDGNGGVDAESVKEWMAFMREWQLSHCNWAVSDKKETASIVVPGASATGGWAESDLTESGRLVREYMRGWAANPPGGTK
jgi:endoglucanase